MNDVNTREIIAQAIWDWLHGEHLVEGGYKTRNAALWGVIDKSCIGIDDQIDLYALAEAIVAALEATEEKS